MMDEQSGAGGPGGVPGSMLGGLGGGFGGRRQPGMEALSPYLNVDPSYLQSQTPEFIFSQEHKRGLLENSFTAIGSSVLTGGLTGGLAGFFDGVRHVRANPDMKGKLRRTQLLNHTLKKGGSWSNSLATIAVVYSSAFALCTLVNEDWPSDEGKSCISGALTGALYKSMSGTTKCAGGAAFGLTLAAAWSFLLKKDRRISEYV